MTTQEQIKSLEEKLSKISDEGIKTAIRNRIGKLKSELEKTEEKVETVSKEEEAKIKELESTIEKLEKAMTKTDDASLKAVIQKRLQKAKSDIAEIKKEGKKDIQEAKQDVKEAQKEIKQEVQEIKKKIERKAPIKKVSEPKAKAEPKVKAKPEPKPEPKVAVKKYKKKEKERVVKSKKRVSKIKTIISDLEKLVEKNKALKAKYIASDGQLKVKDIDRDAARPAKPFGYRFKGKYDYRVPTKKQIEQGKKTGKIDYEARPDRSDKFPKRKVMLEDGGMMADGGQMMARGGRAADAQKFAKPSGWRWKDSAVEDGIIKKASLSKSPSAKMRKEYPDYVYFENRKNKSDKKPSRRYKSLEDGGMMADGGQMMARGGRAADAQKFAKPSGWRWKDSAVEDGIIKKASLSKSPSAKMRKEYPDYVYFENRKNKSDKKPSRRYKSI